MVKPTANCLNGAVGLTIPLVPKLVRLVDDTLFMMFDRPDGWTWTMFVPAVDFIDDIVDVVSFGTTESFNGQYKIALEAWCPLTNERRHAAIHQCVEAGLTLNKRLLSEIGLAPASTTKPAKIVRDFSLENNDMLRGLGHGHLVDVVPMKETGFSKAEPLVDLD